MLAAAGNSGGGLESPANSPGVIPVAAGDTFSSSLCSYASYAPGVLVGPGCGIDISQAGQPVSTDGGGSSSATVFASTLVALLRTLRPDASREAAEQWLRQGGVNAAGQPVINGEQSARAAGLGAIVDRAKARMAANGATESDGGQPPAVEPGSGPYTEVDSAVVDPTAGTYYGESENAERRAQRMGRPEVSLRWARRVLTIKVLIRPERMKRIRVSATFASKARPVKRTLRLPSSRTVKLRLKTRPSRVALVALPGTAEDSRLSSRPLQFAFRGGRYR